MAQAETGLLFQSQPGMWVFIFTPPFYVCFWFVKLFFIQSPSDNQEMPVDSVPPEKMTLSFSIENLTDSVSTDTVNVFLFIKMNSPMFFFTIDLICHLSPQGKQRSTLSNAETFHREYLTLPTSKPHSNKTARATEHPPHIAPFSRDLQKSNFMVFVCCIFVLYVLLLCLIFVLP